MRLILLACALSVGCSSGGAASGDMALPSGATTWTNFGRQFFASYCVSCHTPGGAGAQQDFAQYSVVKANMTNIRCGTAPAGMLPSGCSGSPPAGQFPIGSGPHPTDGERNAIVAWIDNGAPN
jgi:hypothetical protein